jgi:tRNA1Val (adenine37-N6)-methyltransferase
MPLPAFRFKKFSVEQDGAVHPVGTDAVLLGAWADIQGANRILDIGTGTGVLALMLAQRRSAEGHTNWNGVGVELHPETAALARGNFAGSPWATHLALWEGEIQQFSSANPSNLGGFDLIVSNPPFFSELTVSPDKTRSLGRHTATLSSIDLLHSVGQLLAPNGRFCAVLPEKEGWRLCEFAVQQGLYWTKITEVRSRPGKPVERLLLQFEKSPYGMERTSMSLFASERGETYSDAFRALSQDFYLAG